MFKKLKKFIPPNSPLLLAYHKFIAICAAIRFGFPAKKMVIIGITGTDGKTTTTTFTHGILTEAGIKAGMLSTTQFRIGNEIIQNTSHKTTLPPFKLQALLKKMLTEKCTHVVIETSSHAIAQNRIWGIPYDIAVMTNMSPEHLDYHKTFLEYRREKAKLFRSLENSYKKKIPKTIILNTDDKEFGYFNKIKADRTITYGTMLESDVQAVNPECNKSFTKFTLIAHEKKIPITINIPGSFNIYNALAAACVGFTLGIKDEYISKGISSVNLVPGRMERINCGQNFEVIIDFAMTPKGYETLLSNVKKLTAQNLWIVFGCCGDRDKLKRPIIGELSGNICDRVIITDDEPYTEDSMQIIKMIEDGVKKTQLKLNESYFIIPDRREAIRFAIGHANENDIIIIPGMGDLEGRTYDGKVIPWSDRDVVQELLQELMDSPS